MSMEKVVFYHFLQTKAKEEENNAKCEEESNVLEWEVVEKRAGIPQPIEHFRFPWEIKKVIAAEDLGPSMELNPVQASEHIVKYLDYTSKSRLMNNGDEIKVQVRDMDTDTEHFLSFKKCLKEGRFIVQGNWDEEFVQRRGLKAGMLIGMYWDLDSSALHFSVLDDLKNGN